MKNFMKLIGVVAIAASFAACQGNGKGNRATLDSVATRTDSNGTSTTVDTLSKMDTASTDTTKK